MRKYARKKLYCRKNSIVIIRTLSRRHAYEQGPHNPVPSIVPQFQREQWQNLNGPWSYTFDF